MVIILKQRRPKKSDVIEIEKSIIEIMKDGDVVGIIYPSENGIRVVGERFEKIEANSGKNFCPQLPLVIIDF